MSLIKVSDDELVFLVRQQNDEALAMLAERMKGKQDRMIRRLLRENRQCGLEFDDLKLIAHQSLLNTIDSYDPRKAVFDAYYHLILEHDLTNEMKKFNTFNQTILNTAISLDEPLEDGGALYDLIGQEDDQIGAIRPEHILSLAEDSSAGFTPIEKAILAYRMLASSYREIGRITKLSYRQVSRILSRLATNHLQTIE